MTGTDPEHATGCRVPERSVSYADREDLGLPLACRGSYNLAYCPWDRLSHFPKVGTVPVCNCVAIRRTS